MSGISSHVLDMSTGRPAAGIHATLSRLDGGQWLEIASRVTDADGRVGQFLPGGEPLVAGTYRISFATGKYFDDRKIACLYPLVEIAFLVREAAAHYHIPLLLAANGYTTYRGS